MKQAKAAATDAFALNISIDSFQEYTVGLWHLNLKVVRSDANDVWNSYRKLEKIRERCCRLYEKQKKLAEDEKKCRRDEALLGRLPDRDYSFCVVDKNQTRILFGDASAKLIDFVKK